MSHLRGICKHEYNRFERLYNNKKKHDMEISTGVPAYRLLKNNSILEDKQQLAGTTFPILICERMENQLRPIYDNLIQQSTISSVKVEPVFKTRGYIELVNKLMVMPK